MTVAKLVHEQLAMQWLLPSSHGNQDLQQSAWFFFELMVKAMVEHLATTSRLGAPRKSRFSETFHNDVINLVGVKSWAMFLCYLISNLLCISHRYTLC